MITTDINPLWSQVVRRDLPGRFNEVDIFRAQRARLMSSFGGRIVPPYEVLIHPSSACNLGCVWCIGDHVPTTESKTGFLDASKFNPHRLPDVLGDADAMMRLVQSITKYEVRVDRESTPLKVENISFSGLIGEPLVSKKALLPALRFLVAAGRRVGIFTNGILLDENCWDTILDIAYVHVSLDAARGETYAKLKYYGRPHGERQFEKVLSNLKTMVQKRSETKSYTAINTSFIVYPENVEEIYDAAFLLKSIGVDCLRVKHDISGEKQLSPAQQWIAQTLLDRIESELCDDTFRLIRIHDVKTPGVPIRNFTSCEITKLIAAVGSDGHLYPCNYHPRPGGASYGNAVEDGFEAVWTSSRRVSLHKTLPSICPKVCDPFKGRANNMLAVAKDVFESGGEAELYRQVERISG